VLQSVSVLYITDLVKCSYLSNVSELLTKQFQFKQLQLICIPFWADHPLCIYNRTEAYLPEDIGLSESSENGAWNGIIKLLEDEVMDVSVTALTMTSRRASAVDFSVPLLQSRYNIKWGYILWILWFFFVYHKRILLLNACWVSNVA
jgi:hypothetical protein